MTGLQQPKPNEPTPPRLGKDTNTVAQELCDAGQLVKSDVELAFTFDSPVPPSFVNLERLSIAQRICELLKEPERLMRDLQRESIMQRLRKPIAFFAVAAGYQLIVAFADSTPFLAPMLGIFTGLLLAKAFLPRHPSDQLEQNMRLQAFETLHQISTEMKAQILSPEVTKRAQKLWSDRVHATEKDLQDSIKIDKMIGARLFFKQDSSLEALQSEAIAENKETMTPLHLLSPEKADRIRNILQNMQEALVVHGTMGYLAEDDPDQHEVQLFSNYVISGNNVGSREDTFFKVIIGLSAIAGCDIGTISGVLPKNS